MDQLNDANPIERRLVNKATQARIPITANFELTPLCNLKCDMCYIRMEKASMQQLGGLVPLNEWLRIAEELKSMGTLFILLTGGEPLLYPDFKELYTQLRKMGFIITMNTNGTLINEEIIKLFRQYKPRRINVTLYGANNETYTDLCHSPNGFTQTMQGLESLKRNQIDTKINISLVKQNQKDYTDILEIGKSLDIPVESSCYMYPCTRSTCNHCRDIQRIRVSPYEAAEAVFTWNKYRHDAHYLQKLKELDYLLEKGEPLPDGGGLNCRAAKSSCWINWKGEMTPCCMMETPFVKLSSSPTNEAWKTIVREGETLPPHTECNDCKLRIICDTCYAAANHEKEANGNLDYLCQMAEAKRHIIKQELNETY